MSQPEIEILVSAVDKATAAIKEIGNKIDGSMDKINTANSKVDASNKKVEASGKQVALAFNNVATSGMALYNAIDRVQDMQVQVDKANLAVKSSLNSLEDAQTRYNKTVEKFGILSPEATAALSDLQIAQERHTLAQSKAEVMQGNLNEAMVQSALTVIPSLITMITSVMTISTSWTAVTHGVSGALSFLAANPIILVIAAIAALVIGLIWLYNNCQEFRDLINTIGAYLGGAFKAAFDGLVWLWNNYFAPALAAIRSGLEWLWNNILVPLANYLVGTFVAAWNTLGNAISWVYNTLIKPIFDALNWAYNNILKPIADFLGGIASAAQGAINAVTGVGKAAGPLSVPGMPLSYPGRQKGGIVTSPQLSWIGEAGPEAVIPLSGPYMPRGLGGVTIQGPLIYVAGNMDDAIVDKTIVKLERVLGSVLVENSSSGALTTHKRIRYGSQRR